MKHLLIVFLAIVTIQANAQSVMPRMARIAGKGIMIFAGEKIPQEGGLITGYKIERKANGQEFREVTTLTATKNQQEFKSRINNAAVMLPYPVDMEGFNIDSIWIIGNKEGYITALGFAGLNLGVLTGFNVVWLDQDVQPGEKYQYRVTPIGNATAFLSEEITYNKNVPIAKLNFIGKEYQPHWMALRYSSNRKNIPVYLDVYRSDNKGSFRKIATNNLVSPAQDSVLYTVIDTTVSFAQVYQYYLKAYDALGNEAPNTDTVLIGSLSTPRLAMPNKVTTTSDTASIAVKISWTLEHPELVRSVRLMRSTNSVNGFKQLAILSPKENIYFDQSVEPMTPYFYYFEVTNKLDSIPKRSTVFAGTYEHNAKPFAAIRIAVTGNDNGNIVTWSYPYHDASGFYVYRMEDNKPMMQVSPLVEVNTDGTYSFTDNTALQQNHFYSYTIRTISKSNVIGDYSDTVMTKAVSGVNMNELPVVMNVSAGLNEQIVSVFWDDLKEADETVTGYIVLRKKQGNTATDTFRTARNFFADKQVSKGATYTYEIIAVNAFNKRGAPSQVAAVTIPNDMVLPPGALRANALKEGISLQWERPENGESYTYNIYRYTRNSEPKLVGNVKAADIFTDKSVTKGETYFYKIRSLDTHKKESDDSEEVGIEY